jgi:hypothetical protein
MTKRNPFDYVKSINKKTYEYDLSGYNPFLTNRAFAGFIDTIMFAESMNQHSELSPYLQYQFYYYGVRKGSRFDPISKPSEPEGLEVVMAYYNYSKQKALEVMSLLTKKNIISMIETMDKGGR